MSAFLGIIHFDAESPSPGVESAALPCQPWLGPPRFWKAPGAAFILRQRTVTPEDLFEAQPCPAWQANGAALFDGRLDDRQGLSEALGINPLRDVPDSALVVRSFERWGVEAPSRIVGDFAMAAWNGLDRSLMLSADPGGTRPLYYFRDAARLIFSNVLPALLASPGVPREIDEGRMAEFLAQNYHDNDRTIYRGVRRVLGGTTVIAVAGGERIVENWDPLRAPRIRFRSDGEYVDAAREVLDRAVAARLRSIKPVPIIGSGGLDTSCLVVSALGLNQGAPLNMVTMVPEDGVPLMDRPGHYRSERAPVEALSAAFPRLQVEFVGPEPVPDLYFAPETIFEEAAVPMRNILNVGSLGLARLRMREMGAQAVLNGGNGNITLSWNGVRGLAGLFESGRWLRLISEAGALGHYRPRRVAGHLWHEVVKPLFPRSTWKTAWHEYTPLNSRAAAEHNVEAALKASGQDARNARGRDLHRWFAARQKIGRAILGEFQGWVRARYGFETRSPLSDIRLIEFCISIPPEQFMRNGRTRWLARRLLQAAGVPAVIVDNTNRGAPNPQWFAHLNRRRHMLQTDIALLRQSPMACRLLDLDRLERIIATWPGDPESAQKRVQELDLLLTRGLHAGAFMRWAESGNHK